MQKISKKIYTATQTRTGLTHASILRELCKHEAAYLLWK